MSRDSTQLDCAYLRVVSFDLFSPPLYGGSASPFIDEGAGFYKGEGFRMRTLLSLVAHVYLAWFFILMSTKEDKHLQYC